MFLEPPSQVAPLPGATAHGEIEDANSGAREFAQNISEQDLSPLIIKSRQPHFAYPPDKPRVFVKFTNVRPHSGLAGVRAQADMQRLAWEWLRDERQRGKDHGIRVPEVYRVFEGTPSGPTGSFFQFLIMELLPVSYSILGAFVSEQPDPDAAWERCLDQIAGAVQLFRQIPVPAAATPGPYTTDNRTIRHCMFKDQQAYVSFLNVAELQDFINRVASSIYDQRIKRGETPACAPPIAELEQELEYCYTDFNDENFMFCRGPEGRPDDYSLCVVDFEHSSFLPQSFLAYALKKDRFLSTQLARRIPLPDKNLSAMLQAGALLGQCGWKFGMTDEQKRRAQTRRPTWDPQFPSPPFAPGQARTA
ncbi:hypothetical protein MCOR27_008914 [Pyricularia oryzae]|uniref:Aminoglycoside phosphotransferase domain-containing protein n=1 Tax=Pyricularia grisea TaxID=148305 RepID=A0ABQ8NQM7_PYRGI|nr:hypothetical protein MCOR01_011421 [Pyricularia oryzae]KAI6300137.1 hypothetical protein MCOR33_004121 [Pyricularia grisea]KAI6257690.1 hypothetical protein MCOR19_005908 [Pyricularia oryzae]KAI6268095.1 hypothetical protein MCOR26_009376 [Pyricularia oryzae]KAI6271235.1 hypothetical protein MCOR27_008914 [Pyricularia oryzae]